MNEHHPPGLDPARLRAHLDRERPGLVRGALSAELIEGGRSNLTYRVTDGVSRWVVRRPPLGHVLATAHDMAREHRVISALGPTEVPVPHAVLLCEDDSVLGAPFYVMDHVDFLERQLRRWGKQLDASRSRDLPGRIAAVLDWEMSTLGDPLTDLGLLVMYSGRRHLAGVPIATTSEAPGHPEPEELVERYATGSGRDVSEIAWYTAFAYFKLAVILEGIHYRHTLGQTVGAGFDRIGDLVPVFVDNGLTTLQEG
ncbi:phosphotransferase family protein [Streptomyces megasporus]|uniref:phosphotransferase family protein n=1 Tax=Streptomyces megasporus TaxID=44060 RepID=UPI0004E1CAD7|nr:phosphotransferase family protein [Streptomyces megasporus]